MFVPQRLQRKGQHAAARSAHLRVIESTKASRSFSAYHCTRIAGYTALGAVAGAFGASVAHILPALSQRYVLVALAAALLLFGSAHTLHIPTPRLLSALIRKVAHASPSLRGFVWGGLTPLFPCAVSWTALPLAAATGSPSAGAMFFFTFALSSSGMLIAAPLFGSLLPLRLHDPLRRIAIVLAALMLCVRAFALPSGGATTEAPSCHEVTQR